MKLLETESVGTARRSTRLRRIVRRTFYAKLGVAFCLLLVAFAFYLRLVAGPVSLQDYSDRLEKALAGRIGAGWRVELAETAIELQDGTPAVRTSGLEIRNPAGQLVVRAPHAIVSLDPRSLMFGALTPREIELRDLQLLARVASDGTLSFLPPSESAGDPAAASAELPASASEPASRFTGEGPTPIARAVSSLLDPVLGSSGLIAALDRAVVADAKVTVLGADGRERSTFRRVNARFERVGVGTRRMSLQLEGPRGSWELGGELAEDAAGRRAELVASAVPLEDVLLLGGMSRLPTTSDLKLSGSLSLALSQDRLSRFEGRLDSTSGTIAMPGQKPLPIDRSSVRAAWDEAAHQLAIGELLVKSGRTEATLSGALVPLTDGSWHLGLAGRNATWSGATGRDPAVAVSELAAEIGFTDAAVVLERMSVRGDALDIGVTGATLPGNDGAGLRAKIVAGGTGVRHLLAFWPEAVNPELRGYLAQNLLSGTLDRMELRTELDAGDLRSAFSGKPIADAALALSFAASGARLNVIDGLPHLRKLDVVGTATGTTTTLAAREGRLELPDGRHLVFSEGSYRQTEENKPTSIARIGFRLDGGADALASFLRAPIFREVGAFDIDPGRVKGRAELKVSLPLTVHRIPPLAELPVSVSGMLSDIAVDGIVGREKLDGARFTLGYESGALTMRGEGTLGGSPATFQLRQPKGAPGEVVANLTLDDAARARRSLPSAPQVTGPVAVRLVAPFGSSAKTPTRVEADLGRAAIDGLLPGWTKAAGRPGKVSFAFGDGEGVELRELAVESGAVQLRGSAGFSPDGALDRAELGTLKLSPGDDMRASVERSGSTYRVALKGNVGDSRPVLRWLTGSGGGGGQKGREPPDLDVDAAVNIVTGHNDEALTGVAARVATRGRELRALQIRGQFRAAPLDAQLVREGGTAQLLVRSGDAGSTLRFLDLYKRMIGGDLVVKTSIGDVQAGTVSIGSFSVRNEPALRSIAANTSQEVTDERTGAIAQRLEADQVDFTKLDAEFRRSASRVEYKDVVVWGSQVGFTLGGYVDYARDRTEILGTFVPAYGLNNAFSQVPIVGLLLGGGNKNEGLFAIDFKVSGQASAPTLTVNPLTAVAPGILRKLFSWMLPEDDPSGTTALPPGAQERRPGRAPPRARPERPN